MRYLVTSEEVAVHQAVVEADDEDDAAEVYLSGEWVEDRGETFDTEASMVLSVERVEE